MQRDVLAEMLEVFEQQIQEHLSSLNPSLHVTSSRNGDRLEQTGWFKVFLADSDKTGISFSLSCDQQQTIMIFGEPFVFSQSNRNDLAKEVAKMLVEQNASKALTV